MKFIGWLAALVGLAIVIPATFGAALLWIIPGVFIKDRTNRSLVAAVNWVTWLGPFGLIPLAFGKPLPDMNDPATYQWPGLKDQPRQQVPPPPA